MEQDPLNLRFLVLYEVRLGTCPAEIHRKIEVAFGPGVISRSTVSRWAARFKSGESGLKDKTRSGRPAESPCMSATALASSLGVSRKTVERRLKFRLKME